VDDEIEILKEDDQAEDSYISEESKLSIMAKERTVEY